MILHSELIYWYMCICSIGTLKQWRDVFHTVCDFALGGLIVIARVSFLQRIKKSGSGPAHMGHGVIYHSGMASCR